MNTQLFVNLHVKNLEDSITFFSDLGFTFNPQFTNENATCMVISESNFVMLLMEKYFQDFTHKKISDTVETSEVIISLSCESKEKVDELTERALALGATFSSDPMDMGFMYSRSFQDLDHHIWEYFYMDPSHIEN